jgi:hypothetical protein
LIVLSLTVGGVGGLAAARSILVTETGRALEEDEEARQIQRRHETCLKRIEGLERVFREELLPTQKGLTEIRQEIEELFGAFAPELVAVASSRDLGKWPPALDNEGGLAWARSKTSCWNRARTRSSGAQKGLQERTEGERRS